MNHCSSCKAKIGDNYLFGHIRKKSFVYGEDYPKNKLQKAVVEFVLNAGTLDRCV